MLLSVIVPSAPQGMSRMLERELAGIDAEVIVKPWKKGIPKATGDFVCLLEEDSAVDKGTIADNLKVFTDTPSYRKLAMVSAPVDYPELSEIVYSYTQEAVRRFVNTSSAIHAVRIGNVAGAVIRRSSLLKVPLDWRGNDPMLLTMEICLDFWEHGLRVLLNPDSLYYAPEGVERPSKLQTRWNIPPAIIASWEREMVT